jgi:hypothetical protein
MMSADARTRFQSLLRWLGLVALLVAACAPAPAPSAWPEAPPAPAGWTSVGSIRGEATVGWTVGRYTFSGRTVAVNASCSGSGTVFIVVGWPDLSPTSGPARFETSAFPCTSAVETVSPSRIELTTALTGAADVNVFVVEGPSAIGRTSFGVSIEERDP